MAMGTRVTTANRQSKWVARVAAAVTSWIAGGPRLNTKVRSRKSMDRAPRSMMRERDPVCLDWWKSMDRDRAWAKVSCWARAWAAWLTGANSKSRTCGAKDENSRTTLQLMMKPVKMTTACSAGALP